MPTYKLHYFNLTGLGESIRFLMNYGGIEFEDIRYEIAEWPENKKKFPFGQVPLLEIDGKKYVQSFAICRYLAKKLGLSGDNELECLEIESAVEAFNDFRLKVSQYFYEKNEEARAEKHKLLIDEILPTYLGKLDEIAGQNGGYLALKKLTWADLYLSSFQEYLNYTLNGNFNNFDGFPNLQKVVSNTRAVPSIKKWIETRPVTFC